MPLPRKETCHPSPKFVLSLVNGKTAHHVAQARRPMSSPPPPPSLLIQLPRTWFCFLKRASSPLPSPLPQLSWPQWRACQLSPGLVSNASSLAPAMSLYFVDRKCFFKHQSGWATALLLTSEQGPTPSPAEQVPGVPVLFPPHLLPLPTFPLCTAPTDGPRTTRTSVFPSILEGTPISAGPWARIAWVPHGGPETRT